MINVTPALPTPYRHGLTAIVRPDRLRQVPAVTAVEADPQERARALYIDRVGEARTAGTHKGRLVNIFA